MRHEHGLTTQTDLKWWLELAPTLDWVFATTYAEGAPHHYIAENRTPELTHNDFVRAARVIRTFGEPAKFYKSTNIYLTSPDGRYKWWCMDRESTATTLVNRCDASHVYGAQNAPRTASTDTSAYNSIATYWDSHHGATSAQRDIYTHLIHDALGKKPRRMLDVGCGTGLALDIGLTDSVRYVGVDPSQAMLNELVLKHPHLEGLHATTFDNALKQRVFSGTRFDAVVALGGSASYLAPSEILTLMKLSKGTVLLSHFTSEVRMPPYDLDASLAQQSLFAANDLASQYGGQQFELDEYIVTMFNPASGTHKA